MSKSARIESREDSKTHSVAKIGENGVFFVKRARCNPRFSHLGCLPDVYDVNGNSKSKNELLRIHILLFLFLF